MLTSLQVAIIVTLSFVYTEAEAPPGYVKPKSEPDKNPPKYEYGYKIQDEKGAAQGKSEARDGIYATGRYYVEGKDSNQNVKYYADDWGFHPYVEYTSVGPHSRSSTQLLLGVEAVKKFKDSQNGPSPKEEVSQDIEDINRRQQALIRNGNSRSGKQLTVPPEQETTTDFPITETSEISTTQSPQQDDIEGEVRDVISQILSNDEPQDKVDNTVDQTDNIQDITSSDDSSEQPQFEIQFQTTPQINFQTTPQINFQTTPQINFQTETIGSSNDQTTTNDQDSRNSNDKIVFQQQQNVVIDQVQLPQIYKEQLLPNTQQQNFFVQQPEYTATTFGANTGTIEPQRIITLSTNQPFQQNYIIQFQTQQNNANQETGQQVINTSTKQGTAALFESSEEVSSSQSQSFEQSSQENDAFLEHQFVGNFGSKIGVTPSYVQQNTIYHTPSRLIENTKNLINGQDVLNINGVIGGAIESHSETSNNRVISGSIETHSQNTNNRVTGGAVENYSQSVNDGEFGSYSQSANVATGGVASSHSQTANNEAIGASIQSHSQATSSQSTSSTKQVSQVSQTQQGASDSILYTKVDVNKASSATSPAKTTTSTQNRFVVSNADASAVKTSSNTQYQSTTVKTIESVSTGSTYDVTEPSAVLVTPRPISTNFLAPITAGIQLQNIEYNTDSKANSHNKNVHVEIQESIPYYLGKFEYPSAYAQEQYSFKQGASQTHESVMKDSAMENIELGKTLLYFPGTPTSDNTQIVYTVPKQEAQVSFRGTTEKYSIKENASSSATLNGVLQQKLPSKEINEKFATFTNQITVEHLPSVEVKDSYEETDQEPAQGYNYQVAVQQIPVEKPVAALLSEKKTAERPALVEVPYPQDKNVPVPATVEKIVEEPVTITKVVEKPVPFPQPYPVEKIVEKPVHIRVEVPKFIDRPYPVEVPFPQPVPYPVEKIVKQPYPVQVPVEIKVPVEKIVERPVHIPHYIDRPVHVQKIVEKPVIHYVDRPYPVEVKVPVHIPQQYVPQTYVVPIQFTKPYTIEVPKPIQNLQNQQQFYQQYFTTHTVTHPPPHQNSHIRKPQPQQVIKHQQVQQTQQQGYYYPNPYSYAPTQSKNYLPPKAETNSNGYLPPKHDQKQTGSYRNLFYSIKPNDYVGLLPPRLPENLRNFANNFRKARSNFNNLRIEYGFMPPLIPSLEIDENGKPIEKTEA